MVPSGAMSPWCQWGKAPRGAFCPSKKSWGFNNDLSFAAYTRCPKKIEQNFSYKSVFFQLLSGFRLTHPMLSNCDIKQIGLLLLCILK